jgi:hypothetical protein
VQPPADRASETADALRFLVEDVYDGEWQPEFDRTYQRGIVIQPEVITEPDD